jgi:hypothetical protein
MGANLYFFSAKYIHVILCILSYLFIYLPAKSIFQLNYIVKYTFR